MLLRNTMYSLTQEHNERMVGEMISRGRQA